MKRNELYRRQRVDSSETHFRSHFFADSKDVIVFNPISVLI